MYLSSFALLVSDCIHMRSLLRQTIFRRLGGCYSQEFNVMNTRDFGKIGMQPATTLALKLAGQGVRINLRSERAPSDPKQSWYYPYSREQARGFLPQWVPNTFDAPFLKMYLSPDRELPFVTKMKSSKIRKRSCTTGDDSGSLKDKDADLSAGGDTKCSP